MYATPTECPVCHDDLLVTRMLCRNCGTAVEGRFALSGLIRLTPEQLGFVEVFLRCEGRINRVEEELGVSYPTVRNRLEEIIHALSHEVRPEADTVKRQEVLQRLARKEIGSEEALRLLAPE